MYQQKSRRCCAMMLAVSVCLRICMFLGLDAKAMSWLTQTAQSPDFARWMLYLESGRITTYEEPEPETELFVLEIRDPEVPAEPVATLPAEPETEPILPSLPAAAASAEEIRIGGGCTYSVDKASLLARPSAMDLSGAGPTVLIIHTHGSEAYTPEPGYEYHAEESYRTTDSNRSVIAVGRRLAQTLEAQGISVIHDETLYDYPSYNDSYANACAGIQKQLQAHPEIQMVLDLHRDAVADKQGNALPLSTETDGESCARLMLVVGTDQGGLSHPGWQENLANALKLQSVLEGTYPGLCRDLDLRTERFNQHLTPGSLLVEVGSNGNTLSEALHSAELLGLSLAALLASLEQTGGYLQTSS